MEVKVIEVSKKVYNVVRSIVASSIKRDYHWNIPIPTPFGYKFVKYKDTRTRQWEIDIVPIVSEDDKNIGTTVRVVGIYLLAEFIVRECFDFENETTTTYTLRLYDYKKIEYNIDTLFDLEAIYITASVPFGYSLCLADFAEKLLFYLRLAEQAKKPESVTHC